MINIKKYHYSYEIKFNKKYDNVALAKNLFYMFYKVVMEFIGVL